MNCFNHRELPAVGLCKSCGKALCEACVAEVRDGLACKGKCEERVGMINRMIDQHARGIAVLVSFVARLGVFAIPTGVTTSQYMWFDFGPRFQVPIGFTIDQLSKAMLLVVTTVGSLIHIYSLGYFGKEEGKSRFFAGLSLF